MAKDQHIGGDFFVLHRHVALIGMMGSGKSTIGRRLATALGVGFVDADREIETAAGMSIADIFSMHGEAAFRDGERKVIARLLSEAPCILATGGGAYMDTETRAQMRGSATTAWLDAPLDVLVKRCAKKDDRPLLRTGDPAEILGRLMQVRNPVYAEADLRIESRDEPHEIAVDAIAVALQTRGDLERKSR